MRSKLLSLFVFALAVLTANAQDDFDPTLPGEPNANYKVTVDISHPTAGSVYGGGSFMTGSQVTISRSDYYQSANNTVFYKFKHWLLNGVEYTEAGTSSSFTYTVGTQNAVFEAVYEEENADNLTSRLYVVAEPADACSFNFASGERFFEDQYAYLYFYTTSEAFKFAGWYNGDRLVSKDYYINYYIGKDDATLTARFTYDPVIPDDPIGNQENVANGVLGDVNGDGKVNMVDVVALTNIFLGKTKEYDLSICDINKDGVVNMVDVVAATNIFLGKK